MTQSKQGFLIGYYAPKLNVYKVFCPMITDRCMMTHSDQGTVIGYANLHVYVAMGDGCNQ